MSDKQLNEYSTNLERFFNLKNKYDSKRAREIQRLIANQDLSQKERQIKWRETANLCVNCNKKGGTIFETKRDSFRVVCGNVENPCSLNIQFTRQQRDNLNDKIIHYITTLQQSKEAIVRLKLDYLMGFISEEESIVEFTTLKKQLEIDYDKMRELIERFHKIVDNLDNLEEVAAKQSERGEAIRSIKQHILKFQQTGNRGEITEAVEIYINDLQRLIQELRTLQLREQYITVDDKDVKRLIKREYGLRELEIPRVMN